MLIACAAPIAFGVVLWRGLRERCYWEGLGERFGFGDDLGVGQSIWLHAVSLGEVSAAAPLVHALQARYPQTGIVVTTSTPTGRMRARALFGAGVNVRYLPYDLPGAVERLLGHIRPRLAIIMETELWPNLFAACARRGVPVVLASARLSSRSVSRYRRFGGLFRGMFGGDVFVAAQSAADAERFLAIGASASRMRVVGNIKFDIELDPSIAEHGRAMRAQFGPARLTWVAGSTHAGEDEQVLDAQAALRASGVDALLVLVPRHPARFDAVAQLLERRRFRYIRRSTEAAAESATDVILADSVGELMTLYAAADAAFVGGSLVPIGGHNLLEPAALGLPVLTGPSHANSREVAHLLLQEGAALQVADAAQLATDLRVLLADPALRSRMGAAAKRLISTNRGSVARLLELIESLVAAAGHP